MKVTLRETLRVMPTEVGVVRLPVRPVQGDLIEAVGAVWWVVGVRFEERPPEDELELVALVALVSA
jgi:hypothetical protein